MQGNDEALYVFSVLAAPVAQTCSLPVSVEIVAGRANFPERGFFFLAPRRRSGERTGERGGHLLSPVLSSIGWRRGTVCRSFETRMTTFCCICNKRLSWKFYATLGQIQGVFLQFLFAARCLVTARCSRAFLPTPSSELSMGAC